MSDVWVVQYAYGCDGWISAVFDSERKAQEYVDGHGGGYDIERHAVE